MATQNSAPSLPPPPGPGQFFLRTQSLPGAAAGRFDGLYLRQYSVDDIAVVLTQSPPKFLRANVGNTETKTGINFTSWAPQHAGRKWGLVLRDNDGGKAGAALWKRVEISEGRSDESVRVIAVAGEGSDEVAEAREELRGGERWAGWMVCEWSLGHPQLFWVTDQLRDRKLPDFSERVRIVREVISSV